MNSRRRMAPRAVAALGAAVLAVAISAGGAGAQTSLYSFGATGLGRGVDLSLGPQAIAIQPLVQVAAPFTRTNLNSIPQSDALSGLVFPGDLAQAVAGEGGTASNSGSPVAWPLTLEAQLDGKEDREKPIAQISATEQFGLIAHSGYMRVLAKLHENISRAQLQRVVLQPDPAQSPILSIDAVSSVNEAKATAGSIAQDVTVRAKGVELMDGAIRIGSVVSRVRAVSDGRTVPEITATTEIVDVRVVDSEGVAHRATIDAKGIHIDDPALSNEIKQSLNVQLDTAMNRIGLSIATAGATMTIDGAAGTASAGGLVIAFEGACEACPSVIRMTPQEARSVISNLPDIPPQVGCILSPGPESPFGDNPVPRPVPFCLQLAIIPVPPAVFGSITVGSALAQVGAAIPAEFGGGGGICCTGPGLIPGGNGSFTGGNGGSFVPPPVSGQPQQPFQPVTTPVFGVFADMPDGVLAGFGAALLFLAVAMGIGPSLRREDSA